MSNPFRQMILTIAMMSVALAAGYAVANFQPNLVVIGLVAALIFGVSFVNIEIGLYILIFSMLLSPEILVGETGGGSGARGVTLRLEDFLLVVIGLSWFAKNAVVKELGLFIRTPINRPIIFYITACLVATMVGIIAGRVEPKTGLLFVLKYFEYFIVYFMVANHIRNTGQIDRFLVCLLLTAFTVAVVGMLQTPFGERVSAPFEGQTGEPNTLGGYLLLIGCVAFGLMTKVKSLKLRLLLLLLVVSLLPPFLLTQSRSSYLGLVPAALTLGLLADRRVIAVGILLIGLLVSPFALPSVVKERILYTFNQPDQPTQVRIGDLKLDTSTSARLTSWRQALADWTRKPVLGYGVTGYAFMDAQLPRVLIETGFIGLAAFLFLIGSVFKMASANLRRVKRPVYQGLIIGFTAGFTGLLVHSLGANTFIIVRIMEPFWFFAGMVAVLPAIESRSERSAIIAATPDSNGKSLQSLRPRDLPHSSHPVT